MVDDRSVTRACFCFSPRRRAHVHAKQRRRRQQGRPASGLRRGEKGNGDDRVPRAGQPAADGVPVVVQQHHLVNSHGRRSWTRPVRVVDQATVQRHRQPGRLVAELVENADVRPADGFRLRNGRVLGSKPSGNATAPMRLSRDCCWLVCSLRHSGSRDFLRSTALRAL